MAASVGRTIQLAWGDTSPPAALAGVREKSVALNGEPIDVTNDDSDGWRELLEEPGENQVNISVSGITKDAALKTAWFSGERTNTLTLTYPDGGIITGSFFLATYTDTGPYNDATTFEAEFQSSGAPTYTPPA